MKCPRCKKGNLKIQKGYFIDVKFCPKCKVNIPI